MKTKTVTVKLDPSTHRWLNALAKANSHTELNAGTVTPEKLLAQAAFCIADYAGRRDGSWEADVARSLLLASGYQQLMSAAQQQRLSRWEESRRLNEKRKAANAWQEKRLQGTNGGKQ